MKRYGSELTKIARIAGDGSHLDEGPKLRQDKVYEMNRLSITEDTWIASGFYSFVVKLKNSPKK